MGQLPEWCVPLHGAFALKGFEVQVQQNLSASFLEELQTLDFAKHFELE